MIQKSNWPQLTSQISHSPLQDVHITYYLCQLGPNNLTKGFSYIVLPIHYCQLNLRLSLDTSDNTRFWPLNNLPFNFQQVTRSISNSNLRNPFHRLLSGVANVISATWVCWFCSLGACEWFYNTSSIPFLVQYPFTQNSHAICKQCVKKQKNKLKTKHNPAWEYFVLQQTKQASVIEVGWKISSHLCFRRVCE